MNGQEKGPKDVAASKGAEVINQEDHTTAINHLISLVERHTSSRRQSDLLLDDLCDIKNYLDELTKTGVCPSCGGKGSVTYQDGIDTGNEAYGMSFVTTEACEDCKGSLDIQEIIRDRLESAKKRMEVYLNLREKKQKKQCPSCNQMVYEIGPNSGICRQCYMAMRHKMPAKRWREINDYVMRRVAEGYTYASSLARIKGIVNGEADPPGLEKDWRSR